MEFDSDIQAVRLIRATSCDSRRACDNEGTILKVPPPSEPMTLKCLWSRVKIVRVRQRWAKTTWEASASPMPRSR